MNFPAISQFYIFWVKFNRVGKGCRQSRKIWALKEDLLKIKCVSILLLSLFKFCKISSSIFEAIKEFFFLSIFQIFSILTIFLGKFQQGEKGKNLTNFSIFLFIREKCGPLNKISSKENVFRYIFSPPSHSSFVKFPEVSLI